MPNPLSFPRCLLSLGLLLSIAACGDVNAVVEPGQTLQAAVDAMPQGVDRWVIEVRPGVYHESVDITRSGLELRGLVRGPGPEDRPILDGTIAGGKLKDGMVVSGANFTISGFLVRNYAGN